MTDFSGQTYEDYYQRAIDAGSPGIKLVLGGTGNGKTSIIRRVVENNPDRKFVYLANRKQLLEQLAHDFSPDICVVLRRDLEAVQRVLATNRPELEAVLADKRFRDGLTEARQRIKLKQLDVAAIRSVCDELTQLDLDGRHLPPTLAARADDLARSLLMSFRYVLTVARDPEEKAGRYRWLATHPVVEQFFPAIRFRRQPKVRLLLMTLQKSYYGFYDGLSSRNLSNLVDDERTVIFLDEFDFLEHELTQMICRAPQINDPFDFTAHYYRAMTNHKLPKPDYPDPFAPAIRQRLEEVVEIVDEVRARQVPFPEIIQFTQAPTEPDGARRSAAIFRTRHAVSTAPLYIHPTERSLQLETRRVDPAWQSAEWLFNKLGAASTRILTLFKELQRDNETQYWEMLRHCFNNTDFFGQVTTIAQFPRRSHGVGGPRGELLDSGYSLFDVDRLEQVTDNEEVAVTFYQMLQTPENLLSALARRHLVFGLSATADLPRSVHHFDLDWLDDQKLLLPTTDEDKEDIQRMTAEKAALRGGRMALAGVDRLDETDPGQAALVRFLEAVARDDEFDKDTAGGHRSQRMHRFFAALRWILDHGGEKPRLLLFLNTFRQVQLLLTRYAGMAADADIFTVEPLSIHPAGERLGETTAFRLKVWGHQMTIVLFNAAIATEIRQDIELDAAYRDLFHTDEPVVVVTQYLSAGIGVNMTYTDTPKGKDRDFTHIGLLEAPYFFFSKPDVDLPPDRLFAERKANIWYLAKLYYARRISDYEFKQTLGTLAHPGRWNQRYQTGTAASDCLLNRMAIFIQALGRVERGRSPMPDQVALLAPEVFTVFQAFSGPEFEPLREAHAPFASANLLSLLEDVAARSAEHARQARAKRDERLRRDNARSREEIHRLVARLETVRRRGDDLEARRDWEHLRVAVLRHDFYNDLVRRYACITSTPYLKHGHLFLTNDLDVLPPDIPIPERREVALNALYATVAENETIREHFLNHRYDLRFDHPGPELFTPYCLQAILAGAIGEEAVRALLERAGLRTQDLPDALFEIADMRLELLPWFIDAKNYSEQTLERFPLPNDDPLWHPTLNELAFAAHAREKLARIRSVAGPESKLIYINLVSDQPRPLGLFDENCAPLLGGRLNEAAIIVVQGALDRGAPNLRQEAFERFLSDTHRIVEALEALQTDDAHEADGERVRDDTGPKGQSSDPQEHRRGQEKEKSL